MAATTVPACAVPRSHGWTGSACSALRKGERRGHCRGGRRLSQHLETAGALAESFQADAREHWHEEASLTPDGGAESPPHIRRAYDKLREAGLVSLTVRARSTAARTCPRCSTAMLLEIDLAADPSLMMVVGLQGVLPPIEKYGDDAVARKWLPRFAHGEVQGCMDLTEPAGRSDLGGIPRAPPTCRTAACAWTAPRSSSRRRRRGAPGLARDAAIFDASKGTPNWPLAGAGCRATGRRLAERRARDAARAKARHPRRPPARWCSPAPSARASASPARASRHARPDEPTRASRCVAGVGLCDAALHARPCTRARASSSASRSRSSPLVLRCSRRCASTGGGAPRCCYRTYQLLDGVIACERAMAGDEISAPTSAPRS